MALPLLSLRHVAYRIGEKQLFEDVTLHLAAGDRVSLIGRNGAGKSTLCKLMLGELTPDRGENYRQPGLSLGYMAQDFKDIPEIPAADFVMQGVRLREGELLETKRYQAEDALQRLGVDPASPMQSLSGGNIRRAVLARALVAEPDVLLLDEPTNHLDVEAIRWLEQFINGYRGAVLLISHDRTFLANVTNRMMWLDRGTVRSADKGFAYYEQWVEDIIAAEEAELQKLGKKLEAETHWLHRGVTARRKRNVGRLHKLNALRAQLRKQTSHAAQSQVGIQAMNLQATHSGKQVLTVRHLHKSLPDANGQPKLLVKDFNTAILRGERVGIIGPNGVGKTTLLRMLVGTEPVDKGEITWGEGVDIAWFDQKREALNPNKTLWDTLCPGGGDTVFLGERKLHVVAYLKQFLFDDKQARSPVGTLSGGEANRLLLAKILLQPSNLLILDEPTNDLDMDALETLLDMLDQYPGTILLVSHDRDFIDRLTTRCWAFEGDGVVEEIIGGYQDYELWKKRQVPKRGVAAASERSGHATADDTDKTAPPVSKAPTKLSFKLKHELENLPARIAALEEEKTTLEGKLADAGWYQRDALGFQQASARMAALLEALQQAEERWLELEMMQEALAKTAESS